MTILISAFGVAGRFAGDLLMTALGWASSLLFGRVPRTHQVFLVLMMALSFLWIVAVVALLVPTVASTLLATTPHPPFVDNQWVGFAVLLSVILLPLCVAQLATSCRRRVSAPAGSSSSVRYSAATSSLR